MLIVLGIYTTTVIISYLSARKYCIKTGVNPNGMDLILVIVPMFNLMHLSLLIELYNIELKFKVDKGKIIKNIFLIKDKKG